MKNHQDLLKPTSTVSFADVAHQTLIFDTSDRSSQLVLKLLDSAWVQRLRRLRQTGHTHLVYMFAEHSRFGHSLGVAHLALALMKNLERFHQEQVAPYRDAVAAAALLHDIGHTAPGSHLAAQAWAPNHPDQHEDISKRAVLENNEIRGILESYSPNLPNQVVGILSESSELPSWTHACLSGGGWNADRGNWTMVDSAMCSVSYGRYNVSALIDAYRLTPEGELILLENRLDALAHFYVARDSMYKQVYQHRVLQAADAVAIKTVVRLRDILNEAKANELGAAKNALKALDIYCDGVMLNVLCSKNYAAELPIKDIFHMTEDWWHYHVSQWTTATDPVVSDLSRRLRDRDLFKTVRLPTNDGSEANQELVDSAKKTAKELGFDPRYYVIPVSKFRQHSDRSESYPRVLRDDGSLVRVNEVEPMLATLLKSAGSHSRKWLAVPDLVKEKLGRYR